MSPCFLHSLLLLFAVAYIVTFVLHCKQGAPAPLPPSFLTALPEPYNVESLREFKQHHLQLLDDSDLEFDADMVDAVARFQHHCLDLLCRRPLSLSAALIALCRPSADQTGPETVARVSSATGRPRPAFLFLHRPRHAL
jgi:hypothetical protein